MRLLIVEDNPIIAHAIKDGLEQESYAVDTVYDGQEGYLSATSENYDIIVLDVMLPLLNGVELCQKLRSEGVQAPIIMLTAKNQHDDIVKGLDAGADDYLAKPFNFDELLARIRALLRRPVGKTQEILEVADLTLNPNTKQVTRAGKIITLTAKEYALLEYLMRSPSIPHSKQEIIDHVWNFESTVLPNNVELFIMFLRKKIDKPFTHALLHTVPGFGYKIEETHG